LSPKVKSTLFAKKKSEEHTTKYLGGGLEVVTCTQALHRLPVPHSRKELFAEFHSFNMLPNPTVK